MTNEEVLELALSRLGVTRDQLRQLINVGEKESLIGYTSAMDGFGTPYSDVDLYVVRSGDEAVQPEIRIIPCQDTTFDVEYVTLGHVRWLITECQAAAEQGILKLNIENLKRIYRLVVGVPIGSAGTLPDLKTLLPDATLQRAILAYWQILQQSTFSDASALAEAGDWESALFVARAALLESTAVYVVSRGRIVLNAKWFHRAFIKLLGHEHPLFQRYWSLLAEVKLPLARHVENLLAFSQELLHEAEQLVEAG